MIDPDFDPLEQLNDCKIEIMRMSDMINHLIDGHNRREHIIGRIVDQQKLLIEAQKKLSQEIVLLRLEQAWQEELEEEDNGSRARR